MENNSWRLVSDLIAYFPSGTKSVYLAATEKKNYQAAVIRQIPGCYNEIPITLNEFEFKLVYSDSTEEYFEDPLKVYIRNKEFPSSEVWYKACNFHISDLGKLLTQLDCRKGEFSGIFEAAFCEETPEFSLVCKDMTEYMSYFNEMKRRLNCELYKKTKKWIPGHRYDTLKTSYYYLCSVRSRKQEPGNSEFISDITLMPEAFLYVENIKPEDKSISDIFNNRVFGDGPYDIKSLPCPKSMVDCGEVLVDDYSGDIRDYWPNIIENSIKDSMVEKEKGGFSWCDDITELLGAFTYQDFGKADIAISEDLKNKISEAIESNILNIILYNWNIVKYRSTSNIGPSEKDEDNIKSITKMFFSSIKDTNFLKNVYYLSLLSTIGISIEDVVKRVYLGWSESEIYSNFENYYKYLFYTEARIDTGKHTSTQRVKSTNYKLDVITLEDLYGNGELRKILLDILNDTKDSFGLGVSEYITVNMGTKKEPKEYTTCKITLDDIISFKTRKGVIEMSETLKNEIMKYKFCSVTIAFDKDGEIK